MFSKLNLSPIGRRACPISAAQWRSTLLRMEHTAGSVTTGRLVWNGRPVRCPECGLDELWTLRLEREGDSELALGVCTNGHSVQHPLIYPELVHTASGFHRDGRLTASAQAPELQSWTPHWRDGDGTYRDWNQPGPIDWPTQWPDVVVAHERLDEIAEVVRTHSDMDTSAGWMLAFGTTEPDLRHIELPSGR